jgi:hypothetical protein
MRCCGRGMCISGWVTQNTPKRDRDLRVHEMSSAPPCPPRAHPPLHASDLACFACVLPGSRPPEGEARAPWAARPRDFSYINKNRNSAITSATPRDDTRAARPVVAAAALLVEKSSHPAPRVLHHQQRTFGHGCCDDLLGVDPSMWTHTVRQACIG